MMQQCPRCREYEVVWMPHDRETGASEPTPAQVEADEGFGHVYCRNCDYGACEYC